MINLKDCITKYIGYVFAGSGAMIYGLAKVENPSEVTFISASFSMLVSLVLVVLFYKFNSHNRFAGFCKLLNHERHNVKHNQLPGQEEGGETTIKPTEDNKEQPLFSWEITVGDLRWLESKTYYLGTIFDDIEILEPSKEELRKEVEKLIRVNNEMAEIDHDQTIRGLSIIVKTIFLRNIQTNSWGFPPLVVCIFLFIVLGFLGASIFTASQIGFFQIPWLSSYLIGILVLQLYLWWHISGWLYSLMSGSSTVYSFFWKFMPLRTLFLNKQEPKIIPEYISIENSIFGDTKGDNK